MATKTQKTFVLYDGRAKEGGTDDATVLDTAVSASEARRLGRLVYAGEDAIWFEYDDNNGQLKNETARWDLPPNGS